MGYTTEFTGRFLLDKALAPNHLAYLVAFTGKPGEFPFRHMQLNNRVKKPDPLSVAVGLDLGEDKMYFVWAQGDEPYSDSKVKDNNKPPAGVPSLHCQWVPSEDAKGLEWDGSEKFYEYEKWIKFLIEHFLKPWGYTLNGRVLWYGEDHVDVGLLIVENNEVRTENLIENLQLTL